MNHILSNDLRQVRTLAWEFWARGWRGQLLGLAGVIGFASLFYGAFASFSPLSFDGTGVGTELHLGFFWTTLILLGAPIFVAWGDPKRRYTLPTSSLVIVACPMVCSMVSMFVLYALAATTVNILFDAGWPILAPGLVAALSVAWLQAILWSTSNSPGLQLMTSLVSFVVLLIGVMVLASPGDVASGWSYEGVRAVHVLVFGLGSVVCISVGTIGFAGLRHGSGPDVSRIADMTSCLFPKTARRTPFASATSAQAWLEWTERGYVMPVGTALIGIAVLLAAYFMSPEIATSGDSMEFISGCSAILLMPILVVGIFLGGRSANGPFGNFNGSRSLTDGQIAKAVLLSTTIGVAASALVWVAFMAAVFVIIEQPTGMPSVQSVLGQIESNLLPGLASLGVRLLGVSVLVIGGVWSCVSLVTSLYLAGKRVPSVVVITIVVMWIMGIIGSLVRLPDEARMAFKFLLVAVWVILPLACVFAAFVAGLWLRLISRYTLALAAVIVAAMFVAARVVGFTSVGDSYLPVLWVCSLTPTSLAIAPLAVWWNRHR